VYLDLVEQSVTEWTKANRIRLRYADVSQLPVRPHVVKDPAADYTTKRAKRARKTGWEVVSSWRRRWRRLPQTVAGLSKTHEAKMKTTTNKLPKGWTESCIRHVIAHYEEQSETATVAEDEAAYRNRKETMMEIPVRLVPSVRRMLAKHAAAWVRHRSSW
jgi:hypothetical protein